jgi:hypothetical protein
VKTTFEQLIAVSVLGILALLVTPAVAAAVKTPQADALANVKSMPDEGRWHLHPGEEWTYNSYPPTSGPHAPIPTSPGFYRRPQPFVKLVHALEHGNIVIYYDHPGPAVLARLRQWAKKDTGPFDGVIVTPLRGIGTEVILTAWTKLLRLKPFDLRQAAAFLDAFRGKGPERGQAHSKSGD